MIIADILHEMMHVIYLKKIAEKYPNNEYRVLQVLQYNNKRNNPMNWFNKYKGHTIEKDISTNPKEYDWTWHNLNCKVECLNSSAQGKIGSAYQNLKLFSSIDKEYYQNFILQRKNSLNRMKDILEKAIDVAKSTYRGYWESQEVKFFLEDYNKNLKTL